MASHTASARSHGALAAVREVRGHDRGSSAGGQRDLADRLHLRGRVGRERVDRHDRGDAEDRDVLDLLREVLRAEADGLDVLLEERRVQRLARDDLADAAVHLEGADRGDDHGRVGVQARTRGT